MTQRQWVWTAAMGVALCGLLMTSPVLAKGGKGGGGGGGGNRGGGGGNSTPQINYAAINAARQDVSNAQKDVNVATKTLNDLVTKLTSTFEKSDDLKAAVKELKAATDAFEAAKKPVLDGLAKNADYAKAKTATDQAQKEYDSMKASGTAAPEDLQAAAKTVFKSSNVTEKTEREALAADTTVADAKTKLEAAAEKVQQLRSAFMDSLKQNPDWVSAKKAVDDATQKLKDAQTKLATTR